MRRSARSPSSDGAPSAAPSPAGSRAGRRSDQALRGISSACDRLLRPQVFRFAAGTGPALPAGLSGADPARIGLRLGGAEAIGVFSIFGSRRLITQAVS